MSYGDKELVINWLGAITLVFVIVSFIFALVYLDSQKEDVLTPAQVYAQECAKRGGNAVTKEGRDGGGNPFQDFKCEGAQ